MKTLISTSVVALDLFGGANFASAGSYNSFDVGVSATLFIPGLPTVITYMNSGTGSHSDPPPKMDGTGEITKNTPFSSHYEDDGAHLVAGELAGGVNLISGLAEGTKTGSSVGFTFFNSTNASITRDLTMQFTATLITSYGGTGVATADYSLDMFEQSGSLGKVTIHSVAFDVSYDRSVNKSVVNQPFDVHITIPAQVGGVPGIDKVFLSASIGGTAAVPEPSSLILAGTAALAGLGLWSRRRVGR